MSNKTSDLMAQRARRRRTLAEQAIDLESDNSNAEEISSKSNETQSEEPKSPNELTENSPSYQSRGEQQTPLNEDSAHDTGEGESRHEESPLASLVKKKPKVEDTHTRTGVLIDNELLKRLNKYARSQGKGFKHRIFNYGLKKALDEFEEQLKKQD